MWLKFYTSGPQFSLKNGRYFKHSVGFGKTDTGDNMKEYGLLKEKRGQGRQRGLIARNDH